MEEQQPLSQAAASVLEILQRGQRSRDSLRETLGINKEQFEPVENELLRSGKAVIYRCRSGGLRLPATDAPPIDDAELKEIERARERLVQKDQAVVSLPDKERNLYSYIERWALNAGFGTVKIVGDNHRRSSWENPDIIAFDCYDYEWLVGSEYEITTIEVKLAFDIVGIWQAAHYRRFSHYVYLACFEDAESIRRASDGKLVDAAVSLGLGILTLSPRGRGIGCFELQSPARQTPVSREVDSLLNDYLDLFDLNHPGIRIATQLGAGQRG